METAVLEVNDSFDILTCANQDVCEIQVISPLAFVEDIQEDYCDVEWKQQTQYLASTADLDISLPSSVSHLYDTSCAAYYTLPTDVLNVVDSIHSWQFESEDCFVTYPIRQGSFENGVGELSCAPSLSINMRVETILDALSCNAFQSYETDTCDLSVISSHLHVDDKHICTLDVINAIPDYLSTLGSCEFAKLRDIQAHLQEIVIYARIGEYSKLFELPNSINDEIEAVYKRPFGIAFDSKSIFGRITTDQQIELIVKLKSQRYFKLIIKPYITQTIQSLFGG